MAVRSGWPMVATAAAGLMTLFSLFMQGCAPQGCRPMSRMMPRGSSTMCAFGIPGVRTAVTDRDDGVDVTLTVVGDASELRKRAHDALGAGKTDHVRPQFRALAAKVHAFVHDEPNGITVHATPIDQNALESMKREIRKRMEEAQTSSCD